MMPNSWNVPDQTLDPESYDAAWIAYDRRQAARDAREGERDYDDPNVAPEAIVRDMSPRAIAWRQRMREAGVEIRGGI
jgi:hypothetical protein